MKKVQAKDRKAIAKSLGIVLSDTFILYTKTLNFHWNVVDERFDFLHKMFQNQYEQLSEAIDVLAEQIRILQQTPPSTLKEFLKIGTLKESPTTLSANAMIRALLKDHEQISDTLRDLIPKFQKKGDEGSADLLIERIREHEKTAWMLRSHL